MNQSLRYYVLFLGLESSRLFEGDRETLIDIQDERFPFKSPIGFWSNEDTDGSRARQLNFLLHTDQRFAYYFRQDPKYLVLVGDRRSLSQFEFITAHPDQILGTVEGDYSAPSTSDLGRVAWPVVKKALAGTQTHNVHQLNLASGTPSLTLGLEAVGRAVELDSALSLFVDEDYQVRLNVLEAEQAQPASQNEDDLIFDAVDIVIEKVLEKGGNVVFLDTAAMQPFHRIALMTPPT